MECRTSSGILEKRLEELRAEYARGQAQMSALKHQQQDLHETLLRISGAILILQELTQSEESLALEPPVSIAVPVE